MLSHCINGGLELGGYRSQATSSGARVAGYEQG